jgi:hypothetical protein
MNDPRLARFAELWNRGLEAPLNSAEEAELQSFLADASLSEAWVERQLGAEAVPAGSSQLPSRLRSAFQRQFRPTLYWGLRLALPAVAVAGAAALALTGSWGRQEAQVLPATENERPYEQVQALPQQAQLPAQRKPLGPPPGLDEKAQLWVSHSGDSLRLNVELARAGRLTAQVLDGRGQLLSTLDLGPKTAGKAEVVWDGRLATGHFVSEGHYKIKVFVDNGLSQEKDLIVEKSVR